MNDLLKETREFAADMENIDDAKMKAVVDAFQKRFHVKLNDQIRPEIVFFENEKQQLICSWNSVLFAVIDEPAINKDGKCYLPVGIVKDTLIIAGDNGGFKFPPILK